MTIKPFLLFFPLLVLLAACGPRSEEVTDDQMAEEPALAGRADRADAEAGGVGATHTGESTTTNVNRGGAETQSEAPPPFGTGPEPSREGQMPTATST